MTPPRPSRRSATVRGTRIRSGPRRPRRAQSGDLLLREERPSAPEGANAVTVTFNIAVRFADIRILEYAGLNAPFDLARSASGSTQPGRQRRRRDELPERTRLRRRDDDSPIHRGRWVHDTGNYVAGQRHRRRSQDLRQIGSYNATAPGARLIRSPRSERPGSRHRSTRVRLDGPHEPADGG
jgi:hypothetical protein